MDQQSIPTQLGGNLPGEDGPRVLDAFQGFISPAEASDGGRAAAGGGEGRAVPVESFGYREARLGISGRKAPPGIWELDGDELIRVDRFDPLAEELVASHPHLWQLDGNQLVRVEQHASEADALMVEYGHQLAEGLAPLEVPDLLYLPTVEDLIDLLEPEHQILVEHFFDNMNNIFSERANNLNINQARLTHEELHRHFGDFEATLRAFQLLEAVNPCWLEEVMDDLREALLDLNPDSTLIARRAYRVAHMLDRVNNTTAVSSLVAKNPAREPAGCSVCLTDYRPYSHIVVLPCHPSHHFHRRCIEVNLLSFPPKLGEPAY
ncbi:hypothetical protein PtA15_11A397 [Puccinia triticina]|uniref:RING-type domain-containing protein n=1 Tax=Puccinia triticina TaxID=208348 RepID=A0ABY7CWQ4_9BASI|nr:uncharacterized protein PtA15_11A397 [Puccinia triticina]WAQ89706.1 hypothetical protein PtA15_11A397 [Puccinia triticina]